LLKIYILGHIFVIQINKFFPKNWCSICAITLLLINSTEQNLQGVRWREFSPTWQNNFFKLWMGTRGDYTALQIVGTVNARYFRNGQTQIHQIYRKFIAHTPAQNGQKKFKIFRGGRGETPLKSKMNVEKLKSFQNIWNLFIGKCSNYSRIELF